LNDLHCPAGVFPLHRRDPDHGSGWLPGVPCTRIQSRAPPDTDSGGIQEEGCILNVPCETLRDNTERPETVDASANMLAGTQPDTVLAAAERMMEIPRAWNNPFGNGDAAYRIIDICRKRGTP
jgi:hypothetical protein